MPFISPRSVGLVHKSFRYNIAVKCFYHVYVFFHKLPSVIINLDGKCGTLTNMNSLTEDILIFSLSVSAFSSCWLGYIFANETFEHIQLLKFYFMLGLKSMEFLKSFHLWMIFPQTSLKIYRSFFCFLLTADVIGFSKLFALVEN